MRTDTNNFTVKNSASAKRPRYVVEVAFDEDNTILWYFTSHPDTELPDGVSAVSVQNVVGAISGTSQTLKPDVANATIGSINFSLIDKDGLISSVLGDELVLGRATRRQRVRVYVGYEELLWDDYTLVQTQLVSFISYDKGLYKFTCADVQREMRQDIFTLAKTTLSQAVTNADTTIEVYDTSAFELMAHGSSFGDAPNQTVGYFKIQDEIIRYTGKTATQFTGCTRAALNTLSVEHTVDVTATPDRHTAVEEYIYLELPAVDLMYRLLTGRDLDGYLVMPSEWHLGIPTDFVRLSDFVGIGSDLWDTADETAGLVLRFEGLSQTDGKKFIEQQLAVLAGVFMPIYADGAVGLKRMANVLVGASYVMLLDELNVSDHGELKYDFNSLHNNLQIQWNWEPLRGGYTRTNLLLDADSISIWKKSDPLKLDFRGLHGSRHSGATLAQRFDTLRDRYTGPPLLLDVKALHRCNRLEVGDVVRVRLPSIRDFVSRSDTLDRSFEVQNITIDWVTGEVGLKLFASSQAPGAQSPTANETVLTDAWYVSEGTPLSSVLTITGSNPGHVVANGSLLGNANLNDPSALYYYEGDLQIDAGVTVSVSENVQLRIKGFLQNNGTIDGVGTGRVGAAALPSVSPPNNRYDSNLGTPGYLGTTEAGGGWMLSFAINVVDNSTRGDSVKGTYDVAPGLSLTWDGFVLSGLPDDLRGTSGSTGKPVVNAPNAGSFSFTQVPGAAGGNSGAGLMLVCRGFAQGVVAKVDLSGGSGEIGGLSHSLSGSVLVQYRSGSGAGGAPGAFYVLLDGTLSSASDLGDTTFVAKNGPTPIPPVWAGYFLEGTVSSLAPVGTSYYVGTGDDSTFPRPDMSGARGASRIQYVPAQISAESDAPETVLTPPTNLGLETSAEILLLSDGTLLPRIKVTWTPSVDARTLGYDLQFKKSSESVWSSMPPVLGQASDTAWVFGGLKDSTTYDVRLRAAGAARQVSDWVTIEDFVVVGKVDVPADVQGFTAAQNGVLVVFQWELLTALNISGYEIRYNPQTALDPYDWDSATPLTRVTKGTQITTAKLPPGDWVTLIKAVDTTGQYSENAASSAVTVENLNQVIAVSQESPDYLGTASGFVRHPDGFLIPASTKLASELTQSELFESFVPYPVEVCVYESREVDIGFDDTVRIHGDAASVLGPGVSVGTADPVVEMASRLDGGEYGSYASWVIGSMFCRYFKMRVTEYPADGDAEIVAFSPTADAPKDTTNLADQVIAGGGTTVTFANQYHAEPDVQATMSAGAASLSPIVTNVTETDCLVNVYDASDVSVGGAVNISITGA